MNKFLYWLPVLVVVVGILTSFLSIRNAKIPKETTNTPVAARGYKTEEFANNLNVPWSMAFTSSNRMLVTERGGSIRVINNGALSQSPLYTFKEVWSQDEAGLMGLAIDPNYESNKYIYASLAYSKDKNHFIKVVRLVDKGTAAVIDKVLIDGIIAYQFHDGSRLKFGPDGKLYITTGEATQSNLAQDLKSLNGKILRINADGSIPSDNPFPNSPIFSYGHRNPQGITWDPRTGFLWETEHGPSGFDGPGGGDEINLIKAGANYGWPKAHHEIKIAGTEYPKLLFTPAIAPSGATFYKGKLLPEFTNKLLFTGLSGEGIWSATISNTNPETIESFEKLSSIKVGRVRDIIEGPDGAIYFSTSNRDGRGLAKKDDDKIYKILAN